MKMDTVPENLKSRLKKSYDAIAVPYTIWTATRSAVRLECLDKLLALLPDNEQVSILELGCGAGVPVTEKLLSHPNFKITANDISTTQIALGKRKLGDNCITWVEADMMSLDFQPGSLDVILAFYSVHYLPRNEQIAMLGKIASWLKPGGHMFVNFPAEETGGVEMKGWMGEKSWVYFSGWGAEQTLQKVKEAELDIVLDEVKGDDIKAEFLWVIARKPVE